FQQVGVLEQQEETRLRLDEVRVLVAAADGVDLDSVAAHFARQRRQVFGRGDHFEFVGGEQVAACEDDQCKKECDAFHQGLLKNMRAVRADGELQLEEQLVDRARVAVARAAELSAKLAEFRGPECEGGGDAA